MARLWVLELVTKVLSTRIPEANITHPLSAAICAKIDGCAVKETCTNTTNSQCGMCRMGRMLSNGVKDACVGCDYRSGYFCDGSTTKKRSCRTVKKKTFS